MTTETADVILILPIQMHEIDGEGGNPSNGTLVAMQLISGHFFVDKSERMQRRATKNTACTN